MAASSNHHRSTQQSSSGAAAPAAAAGDLPLTGRHSAATATLLAVSFYHIATTLPVTICYILYLRFPEGDALYDQPRSCLLPGPRDTPRVTPGRSKAVLMSKDN